MFLLLLACTADPVDSGLGDTAESGVEVIDLDQDGSPADLDCDDTNPDVAPGAAEVCDGLDNDCDGAVDNQAIDASPYWVDADQDSWGGGEPVLACTQPAGGVSRGQDCDDGDASVHPEAQEVCDEWDIDQDCDGHADDADESVDSGGFQSFYEDLDGDGLGQASSRSMRCDPGPGQVDNDLDCDDSDAEIGEECIGWDGSYSGSFEMAVEVSGLGVKDSCSGSTQLEVVQSNKTQITGSVTCSFTGILATVIGADWSANIIGGFDSEDTALGDLELVGLITDTWEGRFAGNALVGELSGSTTYEGYKVSYTGGFEVTR